MSETMNTVTIEINEREVCRKSMVRETVKLTEVKREQIISMSTDIELRAEVRGNTYRVRASLYTDGYVIVGAVNQMWAHPLPAFGWDKPTVRRTHVRRDSAVCIAIKSAVKQLLNSKAVA